MDVVLNIAMESMKQYEYPTITITSLRIIREFLKRRLVKIKEHTKVAICHYIWAAFEPLVP